MTKADRAVALSDMQAAISEACGPDILLSQGMVRSGVVLVRNVELLPVGSDGYQAVHRGYGGREAIRRGDAFDAMLAAAARRKCPAPLTPGQIAMGRRYHDLVQQLSADGTKLSSLQGGAGGPDGRDWMDRRMIVSREVDEIRRRVGQGIAMSVRRVRPSDRGGPEVMPIFDIALINAVCLRGRGIKDVLRAHHWSDRGGNKKALAQALCAALDRMIGYGPKKTS